MDLTIDNQILKLKGSYAPKKTILRSGIIEKGKQKVDCDKNGRITQVLTNSSLSKYTNKAGDREFWGSTAICLHYGDGTRFIDMLGRNVIRNKYSTRWI